MLKSLSIKETYISLSAASGAGTGASSLLGGAGFAAGAERSDQKSTMRTGFFLKYLGQQK